MTRNQPNNKFTEAGASSITRPNEVSSGQKSPHSPSSVTKSGWLEGGSTASSAERSPLKVIDGRFVPKAEAANNNNNGGGNSALVFDWQAMPKGSCLDRTDEETRTATITTSLKHVTAFLLQEPSSNKDEANGGDGREGRDTSQLEQDSIDHGKADAGRHGACVSSDAECGLGGCYCDPHITQRLTHALEDSPYVLVNEESHPP